MAVLGNTGFDARLFNPNQNINALGRAIQGIGAGYQNYQQAQAQQSKAQAEQRRQQALGQATAQFTDAAMRGDEEAAQTAIARIAQIEPDPAKIKQLMDSQFGQVKARLQQTQADKNIAQTEKTRRETEMIGKPDPVQQQRLDLDRQKLKLRKEESDLRRMEQAAARETNELRRKELEGKIEQRRQKIESDKTAAKSAEKDKIETERNAYAQAKDTLELVKRIKSSPGFDAAVGAKGLSSLFGLKDQPLSGTDAADTAALIDTLEAKNFLNSIQQMRGMGALSNAEGQKVSAAVQNLSRDQSEEQMRRNLDEIIQITQRGVEKAERILGGNLENQGGQGQAPQAAIDYLKSNPQLADQFRAKYGYLPGGF